MANFLNARDYGEGKIEQGDFPESQGLAWTSLSIGDLEGETSRIGAETGPGTTR